MLRKRALAILANLVLAIALLLPSLARATVSINPNNAGIYYSPANWAVSSGHAITINGGAYFKTTLLSTTTCVLNFNVSGMDTPQTQIYWSLDGGAWNEVTLSSGTVTLTFDPNKSGWPQHALRVIMKSSTTQSNRWNVSVPPSTAVDLTSITLDTGASVALPYVATLKILGFGDSITEGIRTVASALSLETDNSDATIVYTNLLGALLGAEIGNIGFGATGWNVGGGPNAGNVPSLPNSYPYTANGGAVRSFSGIDLIIINDGYNDSTNNTTAQITTVLNGIWAAGYTGTIALLEPFDSTVGPAQKAFMVAGCAASNNPTKCTTIDTTGFFDQTLSSDGIHPLGIADIAAIAPRVAAAIRSYCLTNCGTAGGWRRY